MAISNDDAQEIIKSLRHQSFGPDSLLYLENAEAAVWNQTEEGQRPPWEVQIRNG